MRRAILAFAMVVAAGGVGACSQSGGERAREPGLLVPSAAIIQKGQGEGGTALAYGVLPSSDAENLWVPREEKYVVGPYVLEGSSAFSIYTFDQERISSFWPSYRNRWVVQQGVTVP